ncbi:MAG TPA: response regulator [Bryobacteraceae bacterium]|nr:response regulator [Bryobacteraceae bacterium]
MREQNEQRPIDLLLVEDNPGDVRLTEEALKEGRVRVNLNVVRDGADAVDFLYRRGKFRDAPRPDLILLDLNLPKKSGREVLTEVKADPDLRRIPIVVMTTSTADQDIVRAYSLNANCYVAKPVELDQFFEAVRSIQEFWLHKALLPGQRN